MSSAAHISEAQLTANRQNAQSSTGPRTDESKKRTRLNALRHGLTGQTIVMPYESQQEYEDFVAETLTSLHPANDAERTLAQNIANDSWRLDRARAIEENTFALGLATANVETPLDAALNQAMTYLDHAREIQLLSLYAGRISRAVDKNRRELQALQSERARAREDAFEEEILLFQLAESKGEIYASPDPSDSQQTPEPLAHGFEFSTTEIARIVDRRRRLAEAKKLFHHPIRGQRAA